MEHALHLAAGHFVDDISPTSSSELARKLRAREQSGELNFESEDEDEEFNVADALGKALALITQV